jgi:AraC-like DNA-binding protein
LLRRIRLHKVAMDLQYTDDPITTIAERAGFSSIYDLSRVTIPSHQAASGAARLGAGPRPPRTACLPRECFRRSVVKPVLGARQRNLSSLIRVVIFLASFRSLSL